MHAGRLLAGAWGAHRQQQCYESHGAAGCWRVCTCAAVFQQCEAGSIHASLLGSLLGTDHITYLQFNACAIVCCWLQVRRDACQALAVLAASLQFRAVLEPTAASEAAAATELVLTPAVELLIAQKPSVMQVRPRC